MIFDQNILPIDKRNRLKTKNKMGFAHLTPLKVTEHLYKQAESQKGVYADIGAAYGVDTIQMIKAGGHVVAIDLESQHLDVLKKQLNAEEQQRLEVRCQRFPEEVHLESDTYNAILLSRILIFLTTDSIDEALKATYNALKVGGKVYIITISPFSENWEPVKFILLPFLPSQRIGNRSRISLKNIKSYPQHTRA